MRDTSWRRLLKRLALARFEVNLQVSQRMKSILGNEDQFHLRGQCQGCGACCRNVAISTGLLTVYFAPVRWLFLNWHLHVNRFKLKKIDLNSRTFFFSCDHYDLQTGKCDSYDTRPGLCRHYPYGEVERAAPSFHEGCGFHAELKNADKFRESLEKLDIPDDVRKKLEKNLHLKK